MPDASGQLSLCTKTAEAKLKACAPQQEKLPQWETHASEQMGSPCLPQREKARVQQSRPRAAKNK